MPGHLIPAHGWLPFPNTQTKLSPFLLCFIWPVFKNLSVSVPHLWHFGTDPDPRIRSSDLRIRMRIPTFGKQKNIFLNIFFYVSVMKLKNFKNG